MLHLIWRWKWGQPGWGTLGVGEQPLIPQEQCQECITFTDINPLAPSGESLTPAHSAKLTFPLGC